MSTSVLVVDASPHFASLVHQSLKESGQYDVSVAGSAGEALEFAQKADLQLAIVDFALPDQPGLELVRRLREIKPDLPIVALPLGSPEEEAELDKLQVNARLKKPFYLPDLLELVAKSVGKPARGSGALRRPGPIQLPAEPEAATEVPPWLADDEQAANYLRLLYPGTSTVGVLLTRGRRVWASAGQLSPDELAEISAIIADHWTSEGGYGSLAKFLRLASSSEDLMLYASGVVGDYVLTLVCKSISSFAQVRRHAHDMTRSLALTDPTSYRSRPEAAEEPLGITPEVLPPLPSDWIPQVPGPADTHRRILGYAYAAAEGGTGAWRQISSQDLTRSEAMPLPSDWVPSASRGSDHLGFLGEQGTLATPPEAERAEAPQKVAPPPAHEYGPIVTMVLFPQAAPHELSGPIAMQLNEWVSDFCQASDWPLAAVMVKPRYLGLTARLPSGLDPPRALQQISEDLSQRILAAKPEWSRDLASGRFWARNCLLLKGQPPSAEALQAVVQASQKTQSPGN